MYIPNDPAIFISAYTGALAGMGASDRTLSVSNPVEYSGLTALADAFAKAFDTHYGTLGLSPSDTMQQQATFQLAYASWQNRSPVPTAENLVPAIYAPTCAALGAILVESVALFTVQGYSSTISSSVVRQILAETITDPFPTLTVGGVDTALIVNIPITTKLASPTTGLSIQGCVSVFGGVNPGIVDLVVLIDDNPVGRVRSSFNPADPSTAQIALSILVNTSSAGANQNVALQITVGGAPGTTLNYDDNAVFQVMEYQNPVPLP